MTRQKDEQSTDWFTGRLEISTTHALRTKSRQQAIPPVEAKCEQHGKVRVYVREGKRVNIQEESTAGMGK